MSMLETARSCCIGDVRTTVPIAGVEQPSGAAYIGHQKIRGMKRVAYRQLQWLAFPGLYVRINIEEAAEVAGWA
jgi:hypothetical protein